MKSIIWLVHKIRVVSCSCLPHTKSNAMTKKIRIMKLMLLPSGHWTAEMDTVSLKWDQWVLFAYGEINVQTIHECIWINCMLVCRKPKAELIYTRTFCIFSKKKTGNHYQSLDIWANVMKKSVVFFRLKNVMFNYCIWFNCNQQCFQIKLHCIQRTQIMLSAYALQPNCLFYIACSRQQHSIKWLVFNLSLSLFFLYSLSFQNNQLIL